MHALSEIHTCRRGRWTNDIYKPYPLGKTVSELFDNNINSDIMLKLIKIKIYISWKVLLNNLNLKTIDINIHANEWINEKKQKNKNKNTASY